MDHALVIDTVPWVSEPLHCEGWSPWLSSCPPPCLFGQRKRMCGAVGSFNRLVEIGDDVADVLDADGEAHEFRSHAGVGLLRNASCWWVVEAG